MAQFASELGSDSARYPVVFNAGTLLGGFAGLVAAVGVHRGLRSVVTGAGELVTRENIGMWQRGFALAAYPWRAVVGWALLRWRRRNIAARAA